jgi:hypothetical protein
VQEELSKRKIEFNDDILNEVCIDKAYELLPTQREINEKEFESLLEQIQERTKEKYGKQTADAKSPN